MVRLRNRIVRLGLIASFSVILLYLLQRLKEDSVFHHGRNSFQRLDDFSVFKHGTLLKKASENASLSQYDPHIPRMNTSETKVYRVSNGKP